MTSPDIGRYRQAAEHARQMASRSKDPKIRAAYEDIAAQYDQLVSEVSRGESRSR